LANVSVKCYNHLPSIPVPYSVLKCGLTYSCTELGFFSVGPSDPPDTSSPDNVGEADELPVRIVSSILTPEHEIQDYCHRVFPNTMPSPNSKSLIDRFGGLNMTVDRLVWTNGRCKSPLGFNSFVLNRNEFQTIRGLRQHRPRPPVTEQTRMTRECPSFSWMAVGTLRISSAQELLIPRLQKRSVSLLNA
jgi:hypothetical protein